jgi:hypothetical protein
MILRNLAFSSTHKARIVAECKLISNKISSIFDILAKYIPTIMSHVVSKTSDTAYIGLTALWALIVDAQKVRIFIDIFNVFFAIFQVQSGCS